MASLKELKKIRLEKLKKLTALGVVVYPISTKRNYFCVRAADDFLALARGNKEIILAGRIKSLRIQGGASFVDLQDGSGRLQIFFKKDNLGSKKYENFIKYIDIGDFFEVRGSLFKTKRGEKTLKAADFKILAKALLPLPEKWSGLKDVEEKARKRYLDLLTNPESKKKALLRSQIISQIRSFMDGAGFIEVETPILQPLPGGATAEPFVTHHRALDMDLYLRIAPELYLKRLLVAGIDKVYEIGRCFRNEGIDRSHNPDFTSLEFYWSYKDYKDLMKFTEELFLHLLKNIFKTTELEYAGQKINFKTPFGRIEFDQLLKKEAGVSYEQMSAAALLKKAKSLGLKIGGSPEKEDLADEIYKKICLPKIWQPTFIIHHPLGLTPLAKAVEDRPEKAARFQLAAAGWELVNAFSEQNDPVFQRRVFEGLEKKRKKGEPSRIDEDFLSALEYGMPPAAGFGMGIDRLAALLTDSHSIREVILFPTFRPKNKKDA